MQEKSKAQKIALSGVLIGIAVIFGTFSIPVGAAKISPVQHFVNVVGAITLGPGYAVLNAFAASLIRNVMGTGSPLAFPGSMVGSLLAGILYSKFRKPVIAVIGEIIGTGLIGAMLAYPIAAFILGKQVALFVYIIPFTMSCTAGAIMAYFFIKLPIITKVLIDNESPINTNDNKKTNEI